jgi:hypothetical protein
VTTIVVASTLYGLATAATVLDNEPSSTGDRRLLVVSNNAPMAEIVPGLNELDGFGAVADRFDDVVSLNELIAPYHPSGWRPSDDDLAVLQRLVRAVWCIDDAPVRLFVESIQVRPAQTIAQLFPDAPLTIYADGLMSYGPTRTRIPPEIFTRIDRLVLPDLVPGLAPLLLEEYGIPAEVFPLEWLGKTLEMMSATIGETAHSVGDEPVALIIGQHLGSLGVLSPDAEQDLHWRMVAVARSHGASRVLFKPHPSSPPALLEPLARRSAADGLGFDVVTSRAPVETVLDRIRPTVMISAFSTALVMAQRLHRIACLQVGAHDLLKSLRPYPNSNRIPLVIIESIFPDGESIGPDARAGWTPSTMPALNERVRAVGYVMQPQLRADLRADAETVLGRDGPDALNVPDDRLAELRLGGAAPGGSLISRAVDSSPGKLARQVVRKIRREGLTAGLRSRRSAGSAG